MFLPRNHEKLQVISELVQAGLYELQDQNIPYYDDRAVELAGRAIMSCMPELGYFSGKRVVVEALQGVSLAADGTSQSFDGLHVVGMLQRVSIQQLCETASIEGVDLSTATHDLCAVVVPDYTDPDPVDIVFGQELYVPFNWLTKFEAAEAA